MQLFPKYKCATQKKCRDNDCIRSNVLLSWLKKYFHEYSNIYTVKLLKITVDLTDQQVVASYSHKASACPLD